MKRNNKYIMVCLLMALPVLLFQSCLKDDEKVYGDNAGDRVEKFLTEAKTVLTSAEHGWHLGYFPHRQLKFGGFNYVLKFTADDNVTVWYEEKVGETRKSTYAMVGDDGPVLSFDTYNEFMHYYAKPSQGEYEAKDGDFEFILLKVTKDLITLKGKRSGNIMYMTRLDVEPADCLKEIQDLKDIDHVYGGGTATINGTAFSTVFDMQNRRLTVMDDQSNTITTRTFIFTKTGIQLADTIMVNNAVLKDFNFDKATNTFESAGVTFNLVSTYRNYSDFIGTYTIKELNKTVKVVADVDGKSYKINDLTYSGTPIAEYDSYWGSMTVSPQYLDSWSTPDYPTVADWLLLTDGDMIYWGEEFKATTAVAPSDKLQFLFGSNGYTILEYAFTKKDLNEEGNESLGTVEEYPQSMTWIKK